MVMIVKRVKGPSPGLFKADRHIILYKANSLKVKKFKEVLDRLIEIIKK
jgi:hypothetical protein